MAKKINVGGYVPNNAKINFEPKSLSAPKTEYERRKKILDIDKVKEIVKGKYGNK